MKILISSVYRVLRNQKKIKLGSWGAARKAWKGGLNGGTYLYPICGWEPLWDLDLLLWSILYWRGGEKSVQVPPPPMIVEYSHFSSIYQNFSYLIFSATQCPTDKDWYYSAPYCYFVTDANLSWRRTWNEADDWCKSKGAHLVSIHSTDEQAFVNALVSVLGVCLKGLWYKKIFKSL